ncbi:MAG: N-acetyl-gamma-glutamyl-phosphate reductase [Candidatus Omnitrophota bacterium]
MVNCAIIGATGYTGLELIRILSGHPSVRLTKMTTRQKDPISVRSLIPTLSRKTDLAIVPYSFADVKKEAEVVFVCLPHTEAMTAVADFRKAGKIVIDLSADYRLKNKAEYHAWYHSTHRYPELLREAVYGLPELWEEKIRTADLIANPGCYPTSIILGIAPLLKEKLVEADPIIADSKSGVTGAGKKLNPATQYAELDGNFYAYKVNRHQHTPEILQALCLFSGQKPGMTFVPHLLPIQRGILSVLYLQARKGVSAKRIGKVFQEYYGNRYFIRLKGEGKFPALKDVQGTNYCDLGFAFEPRSGRVIVITAIDNLVKGASGQAVQNMNIRCGFAEEEGLDR